MSSAAAPPPGGKGCKLGTATAKGSAAKKVTVRDEAGIDRRRYAVRKSILKNIFFPHYLHKDAVAADHNEKVKEVKAAGKCHENEGLREKGIREKIVDLIHSKTFQAIFLLLLILDVFIVCAEIIILSHKECQIEVIAAHGGHDDHGHAVHYHCDESNITSTGHGYFSNSIHCGIEVHHHLPHNLHTAEIVLGWISFAILAIFAVELLTLFVCLCHKFFTIMYVLDCVVVFGSIAIFFAVDEDDKSAAALIIFIRMWRFARILHGFGLTIHDYDMEFSEHEGGSEHGGEEKKKDDEEAEPKKEAEPVETTEAEKPVVVPVAEEETAATSNEPTAE